MSPSGLSTSGKVLFATGVLGALTVIPMLAWPVESPAGLVRYPFSPETFRTFQTWFFVHHIGLVVGAVGFALSGATGPGRFGRIAAWLAVIGMVGLTGMELFAIQFGEWDNKVASTGTMGAGYGITTNLVGLGMLGAGVSVLRSRIWSGWRRFTPLSIGIAHFVFVTPAVFSNGWVIARLAIGTWMLLLAALGWGLLVETRLGPEARTA
jgi:hypothetical protein